MQLDNRYRFGFCKTERTIKYMENTFVLGISYKNADISTRSAFSISNEKQNECYKLAKKFDFKNFVVLSTCNRTEIYGTGPIFLAENIITTVCNQTKYLFDKYKFVKTTNDALLHIFHVASGLDSRILGDYEILGQFKNACKLSKENGMLNTEFERMANSCIQASKEIKTKTDLSKGTVSSSYAVIEILKEKIGEDFKKCLLIGTGKFGNKITKNIKHYLSNVDLTLSNRTSSTALEIATSLGLKTLPFEDIKNSFQNYDIIILSSSTEEYIVTPESLVNSKTKLILDLSIPQTVHPECKKNKQIEILDINTISAILDKSLDSRKKYLPVANEIINNHISAFIDWNSFYKQRGQIIDLKNILNEVSKSCPHLANLNTERIDELVNKTIQTFVKSLKQNKFFKFETKEIIDNFIHNAEAN